MAETIVITKKPRTGAKHSKCHNLRRSANHRADGSCLRQAERSAKNKARHIAINKAQGDRLAGVSIPQAVYKWKMKVAAL